MCQSRRKLCACILVPLFVGAVKKQKNNKKLYKNCRELNKLNKIPINTRSTLDRDTLVDQILQKAPLSATVVFYCKL